MSAQKYKLQFPSECMILSRQHLSNTLKQEDVPPNFDVERWTDLFLKNNIGEGLTQKEFDEFRILSKNCINLQHETTN